MICCLGLCICNSWASMRNLCRHKACACIVQQAWGSPHKHVNVALLNLPIEMSTCLWCNLHKSGQRNSSNITYNFPTRLQFLSFCLQVYTCLPKSQWEMSTYVCIVVFNCNLLCAAFAMNSTDGVRHMHGGTRDHVLQHNWSCNCLLAASIANPIYKTWLTHHCSSINFNWPHTVLHASVLQWCSRGGDKIGWQNGVK